jgi:hypothetical protein
MMLPWRTAGQQQQVPNPQPHPQEMQHRIDELLAVLQWPTLTPPQASGAQQELVHLFSSDNPASVPTPTRVQALVSFCHVAH